MKTLEKNVLLLIVLAILSGCMHKGNLWSPEPEPTPPSKEDFFDFSTQQFIQVNIDYGFKDYIVLFELYDQNPMVEPEDGSLTKKEGLSPIFKASTDKSGKFSGAVTLPSRVNELWLYSEYAATISPIRLTINNGSISYHQNEYIVSGQSIRSRAVTQGNYYQYPDEYKLLGKNWTQLGLPDWCLPNRATPPAEILYSVHKTYTSAGGKIPERHPEFLSETTLSDIVISKPTKIKLVFINSGANFYNVVGYYTYPKGQQPQPDKITKVIAFPNIHGTDKTGTSIFPLDQVQMKYWNGTSFQNEFPADVVIGFFLQSNGFNVKDGSIGQAGDRDYNSIKYSSRNLNPDGKQRTVPLIDKESRQIIAIGFEDKEDFNYTDATFYLDIEQKDAAGQGIPALPPAEGPTVDDNSTTYFGTLTYEDMWPQEGDYDMNDVMIDYSCTVYKTIGTNKVTKIVDRFTPRHNGAVYVNGFGYQFHKVGNEKIRSISIEGPVQSAFAGVNHLEAGQEHPTIILCDDIKSAKEKPFTVTTQLNEADYKLLTPPYNPFIIVKTNEGRGKEVHLVNYPPTDKADPSFLGQNSDASQPGQELYYISKINMPFAIHLPNVKDFPIPEESVRIDETYPDFTKWVESKGKLYKDWYLPKN